MAEVEEPQFTSLSARIAALNQSQSERPINGPSKPAKRPPPPPPPTTTLIAERPQPDFRSKSINCPPVQSFVSGDRQYSNEPAGLKTVNVLPPPTIDRDFLQSSPQLQPARTRGPALPRRESLQPLSNGAGPKPSPSLPPRRQSEQLSTRRLSNASMMSQSSSISAISLGTNGGSSSTSMETNGSRKLPPALDQANLPKLPPSKRELEAKAKLEKEELKRVNDARFGVSTVKSAPAVPQISARRPSSDGRSLAIMPAPQDRAKAPALPTRKTMPCLPPRVPVRGVSPASASEEQNPAVPTRRLPPAAIPPMPPRPQAKREPSTTPDEPPPIPRASRPTAAQIQDSRAAAAQLEISASTPSGCLICRDFSGPDHIASQFPRQNLPSNPTAYLASVLCTPFDSATDKARSIFVWLHHNIDYDTVAFFGNNVKHSTPENCISTGLAVCGGYAGIFSAIALHAGMECLTVTGHGKGIGFNKLKPGDPLPPSNPTGHAWNAVRIDNGEWKLVDACWGAGQVSGQTYNRNFAEECFTMSNEDFGLKHFPADGNHFFRADRRRLSWEEYILGPNGVEEPQLYRVVGKYGISRTSFLPASKHISVRQAGTTRFQFSKKCSHWDFQRNGGKNAGKPYCMILKYNGIDGRDKDFLPFEFDGTYWWCDIETRKLGCRPMKVSVYSVTTVGSADARGLTKDRYLAAKGRQRMGFESVATWELV